MVFEDAAVPALGTPADAVQRDPGASYERCADLPLVTDELEQAVIAAQLGRPSRAASAVAHRCAHGLPTVLRVDPRLEDGTPFPTTFWSSCPLVNKHVGTLEADHVMAGFNERLDEDSSKGALQIAGGAVATGFGGSVAIAVLWRKLFEKVRKNTKHL